MITFKTIGGKNVIRLKIKHSTAILEMTNAYQTLVAWKVKSINDDNGISFMFLIDDQGKNGVETHIPKLH